MVALLQAAAAAAELRETVAALESQIRFDEIPTHGLNATLSGKDKEIAKLEALRGAVDSVSLGNGRGCDECEELPESR
jgi:hypothetical protein